MAKFTPLYGYVSPARRALTHGLLLNGTSDAQQLHEPLWQPVLNVVVWTAIFCVLAVAVVRVGRRRQYGAPQPPGRSRMLRSAQRSR